MAVETTQKPRDCMPCRVISSAGLVGIGGYLGNIAFKNKTFAGKYTISCLSFAFIVLGVARFRQTYPFDKTKEVVA